MSFPPKVRTISGYCISFKFCGVNVGPEGSNHRSQITDHRLHSLSLIAFYTIYPRLLMAQQMLDGVLLDAASERDALLVSFYESTTELEELMQEHRELNARMGALRKSITVLKKRLSGRLEDDSDEDDQGKGSKRKISSSSKRTTLPSKKVNKKNANANANDDDDDSDEEHALPLSPSY